MNNIKNKYANLNNKIFNKRGQTASGSAILIIIITALIVLYILFLPPSDRATLLGEGTTHNGNGGTNIRNNIQTFEVFNENIGQINQISQTEREHDIPSFRIGTNVQGTLIKTMDSSYLKHSVFETTGQNISFKIDPEITTNLKLAFNTGQRADGRLIIKLNGVEIANDYYGPQTSSIIDLPKDLMGRYNNIELEVTSPGWKFWTYNEYDLNTIQIAGNIKDLSGAESSQTFYLAEEEIDNIERATLKFYPDCSQEFIGRLSIQVNGRTVYSSIADCGITNSIELDEKYLDVGENDISFVTTDGTYLVTNIMVKTILKEPVYPIYYFDLDTRLFDGKYEETAICGENDGICPEGCNDDIDKDCCFETTENYWCDLETAQLGDRCVSFVSETTCERCESGYEDSRGISPEECEGMCGDDNDDTCLAGCSRYVDKDCCFNFGSYYWCDDIPDGRQISAVCKAGVEQDERKSCPDRYYNEDGRRLSYTDKDVYEDDEKLKKAYEIILKLTFPDYQTKRGTILVNGREIGLQTAKTTFEYDISDMANSHTNSVEIIPRQSIDITSMSVEVRAR